MTDYMTVVYKFNDQDLSEEKRRKLREEFMKPSSSPWLITAASVDHEIFRLDLIEETVESTELLRDEKIEIIEEILSTSSVGDYRNLNDFMKTKGIE